MPNPALEGPYSYDNGMDIYGHPTNGFGRCQFLNANGGTGPEPPDVLTQTTFMLAMPRDKVVETAVNYGMTVNPITPLNLVVTALIALMYP